MLLGFVLPPTSFIMPAGFVCLHPLIYRLLACRQCRRALSRLLHPPLYFPSWPNLHHLSFCAACCPAGLRCRHAPLCGPATLQEDHT